MVNNKNYYIFNRYCTVRVGDTCIIWTKNSTSLSAEFRLLLFTFIFITIKEIYKYFSVETDYTNRKTLVAGWGRLSEKATTASTLRAVIVSLIN
jgi:hypothetical protein